MGNPDRTSILLTVKKLTFLLALSSFERYNVKKLTFGFMSELLHDLSKRERQLLELIIEKKALTAIELEELLPEKLSNSTVRTLLRILVKKKKLKIKKVGVQYVYSPNFKIDEARNSFFQTLKKTFFGGSSYQAVVSLIDSDKDKLTHEELDKLQNYIEDMRKKRDD